MKIDVQKPDIENKKEITFPVLMEAVNNGGIVLFTAMREGIAIETGGLYRPLQPSTSWIAADNSHWKPFAGKITLSN